MIEVKVYNHIVNLGGFEFTRKELAEHFGISRLAITKARERTTLEGFIAWIRKKSWLKEMCLSMSTKVYVGPDNLMTTIDEIMHRSGCSRTAAGARGNRFERGKINKEDLYKPVKEFEVSLNEGSKEWQKLGFVPRDRNLYGIPRGTRRDRLVSQQFGGQCLPGLENNVMRQY